jgi:hypothetical protein
VLGTDEKKKTTFGSMLIPVICHLSKHRLIDGPKTILVGAKFFITAEITVTTIIWIDDIDIEPSPLNWRTGAKFFIAP